MPVRIPIAGPWITEKEIRSVSEAVAHGWYQGEFERAVAAFTGRRHGVALPSCTAALHLALLALAGRAGEGRLEMRYHVACPLPVPSLQAREGTMWHRLS
jgi:dTDP-4-amino-4,6-dideoxygalactose transaminase